MASRLLGGRRHCRAFSLCTRRGVDLAAVVTVLALVGAILVEIWLLIDCPEQAWYDGRRSPSPQRHWLGVSPLGDAPFDNSMNTQNAETSLIEQLTAVLRDASGASIGVSDGASITQPMRELRSACFEERRQAYISERIDDQRRWYESKALYNQKTAKRWRLARLAIESAGVLAALLRAMD
jgi:hypothetical protein